MTTLVVPYHCDGGADHVGVALGLRQAGTEWIGDCPACEGAEALAIRPSRDDRPAHVLCVCRGACVDATALRAALVRILGPESRALPPRNTRTAGDPLNFGVGLPRKRD